MQKYVLDRNGNVVATFASDYNDKHTKTLQAGASTYEFTISKQDEAALFLETGNYVNFVDDVGKPWSFSILSYTETHNEKTVYCEDVGIELINKNVNAYTADVAYSFAFYFEMITKNTPWTIGINEIGDLSRKLEWTSNDTGLSRLLSLLTEFDNAECKFNVKFAQNKPTEFKVDIYKQIGNPSTNVQIVYSNELNDITKTESRAEFVTAIQGEGGTPTKNPDGTDIVTGTNPDGTTIETPKITFADIVYKDDNYVSEKGDNFLRAVTANKLFNPNSQDTYIEGYYSYDTESPQELLNRTLTQLKKYSAPQYTYEADVQVIDKNLDLGDTVKIIDHDYKPGLYLEARVASLEKSYTDPSKNTITFTNYRLMNSSLAQKLADLQNIINGIKNGSSSYVWIRYADDDQGTGISQSPKDKTYVAILAKVNQPVPSDDPKDYAGRWVRIVGKDGLNGQAGPQGKDGSQGIPGKDGKTSYTHIAYADTATGGGFSEQPAGKTFIGMYVDFEATDSTDATKYNWSLIKGADGANGSDGIPGKAGTDGKTPYLHIAYATSADGKAGFSTTDSANKSYMGTYTDYTQADSLDPTAYLWSLIKGEDGANGKDGQDAYLHIAYANSVDGKTDFTTDQNQAHNRDYLGTYSDNTKAQSTDPTKYTWQLTRGAQGLQGQPGSKDVPVVTMSSTAPPNPKNGDFWYQTTTDSSGPKITGFSVYSNGNWVPSKIDQSTLVLTKLVSVEIDSATINSPDITVPFVFFDKVQNESKGSMEFKDGMLQHISTDTSGGMQKAVISPIGYTLDNYNNQSDYAKSNPYMHTELHTDNITMYNTTTKKAVSLSSGGIWSTLNAGADNATGINMAWEDVQKYLPETDQSGMKTGFSWFDMMSSVQSHPNLLKNASLIDGFSYWNPGNFFRYSWVHDGNVVAHISGKSGVQLMGQTVTNLIANANVAFSFWFNMEGSLPADAGVIVAMQDSNNNVITNISYKIDTKIYTKTGTWYFNSVNPIKIPSNADRLVFYFYNNSTTTMHYSQPMLCYGDHVWPYQPT